MEWKSEGPYRPTRAWVHDPCGSRAARIKTASSWVYHCPECDVTSSWKVAYDFSSFRLSEGEDA